MSQQTDLSGDKAREGLPVAEDYDPEALGTFETRAGDPEQTWPEFGLELVPVEFKSKNQNEWADTGRRIVQRNGKFISDVSEGYKLLPNEHLVDVANRVARDLGAEPFHEFDGDWFVELDDHVFQDAEYRRVHALYAWQTNEIGGEDDEMEYGFAVHNSIDGSLAFNVGLFSFRNACANMVFLGTGSQREQRALQVEGEREILNRHKQSHTASLDVNVDALKATIKGTVTLIENVDETYEKWAQEVLTPEDVAGILKQQQIPDKDLPDWAQDIPDTPEEAYDDEFEEGEEMPWERKAEIIAAEMPDSVSKWDTYNTLTEAIWHTGNSSDLTRRRKMKSVHRVFNPVEHASDDVNVTLR